ncbi:hypothetical protein TELCIR_21800, partial [Teladorsagia circumcincta]
MNATSSMYIEQMYEAWKADPKSVHASWDAYFRNVEGGAAPGQAYQAPPTAYGAVGIPGVSPLIPGVAVGGGFTMPQVMPSPSVAATTGLDASVQTITDHLKVQLLIRSFQTRGHNIADLDPLGINSADLDDTIPPELELSFYGFG